eukprot:CAMPEP_0178383904 /NCGR_PEP_ID=MMETSP0689_2-20121128/7240_1 /TAXON_ID=160604 /ORGANISM="Amphidinium massartii, Strain CS-259" /LENGTH=291 /DNA_ID=CAMNT_0020004135 /DNA_START=66 /DNA_END=938 /DNA_ORIENTATION=-
MPAAQPAIKALMLGSILSWQAALVVDGVRTDNLASAHNSELVELAEQDKLCPDLGKVTKWVGAGGNAYVLKFIKKCGPIEKGTVAKAFIDKSYRDESVETLEKLPKTPVLAGLVDAGIGGELEDKCYHAKGDCCDSWKHDDKCYFMLMKNGGSKTLEQCLELPGPDVPNLVLAAINALQQIHATGFYHNDYQMKNLMTDSSCSPASLKVVDIDDMNNREGKPNDYWNKSHRMFRDFAMLLGVCDMGALPVNEFNYVDSKEKAVAAKVLAAAKEVMDSHCRTSQTMQSQEIA